MNGSMSTGRGSRRAMQLWTPTHETQALLPSSSGSHLRAWYLNGRGVEVGRMDWWRLWYPTVVAGRKRKGEGGVTWAREIMSLFCCLLLFCLPYWVIKQCMLYVLFAACAWYLMAWLFSTYVRIFPKGREEGATKQAFCSLIRQHGLIYLTLDPIKMMDAVRTSIKFRARRPALSGGKLQSFTLLSFVITSGSPDNLF